MIERRYYIRNKGSNERLKKKRRKNEGKRISKEFLEWKMKAGSGRKIASVVALEATEQRNRFSTFAFRQRQSQYAQGHAQGR